MSEEKLKPLANEKKLRFRPNNKVFLNCDRIDDLFETDKADINTEGFSDKLKDSASIFSFLNVELTRGYELENDEERFSARREKVYSFMKIPREVEKFMMYGIMQCTDSFLFVYTFLPLRVLLALGAVVIRPFKTCFGWSKRKYKQLLTPAEICDLLKAVILLICTVLLSYVDTNMLYHLIKSQSVIKLYIFYNMLEVGDRLFSAFGQDIIDALFWTATEPRDRKRQHLGTLPHLFFALVYVFLHSLLVLLQATTLNVAINSSNKSLLTIMISNNFVELKGAVFKKFDKNNLFQVSCSDVRERFHHAVLLFVVVLQTLKEYSWHGDRFWVLLPDCMTVFGAEIIVDWIKHAFITRFNELQEDVYRDYTTSLAYDMAQSRQKHAYSDHSDLVARRMGFIPLPLGVVMIRVLVTSVSLPDTPSLIILILVFLCVVTLRILNGILILGYACKLITRHKSDRAATTTTTTTTKTTNVNYNNSSSSNSPLLSMTTATNNTFYRDCATSPLKPSPPDNNKTTTTTTTTTNNLVSFDNSSVCQTQPTSVGLISTAIFANSTVDLDDVTLNEELLKLVEQEDVVVVDDNITKSDPSINQNNGDDRIDKVMIEVIKDIGFKRAESEPNLVNCTTEDEEL